MAMLSSTVPILPPGFVFQPSARQLIEHFLVPKALHGATIPRHLVAEGVDIFSASPDALPFLPSHRREEDGEVWGYFFAVQPAGEKIPAPGGCWVLRYVPDKEYVHGGEVVAFRRRFEFHMAWQDGDGKGMWEQTAWQMKEYRLNKGAAVYSRAQRGPGENMDCVVRKVFWKSEVPPPLPPARSSDDGMELEAGYSSEENRARKRARRSI